ncbi:MAG TPA: hypothetical protein VIA06_12240 [Candidatus Dormibacteraeota bacterium]|jgi:hypothetical protein|nr:hypothetical protein [Candidatus Dormibacteraeota bacterium]
MYAAVVWLTVDPALAPAAAAVLTDKILPEIRSSEGFARGYWLEPADGRGFAVVMFETEGQARAMMESTGAWTAPGVVIDQVEVRRVAVAIP